MMRLLRRERRKWMSSKKAKALRRMMYGDGTPQKELKKDAKTGTLYADTARQRYQMAKGRKACLPIMGRMRIVAKRPRVVKSRLKGRNGAFGEVNRLAGITVDMKVIRRSERVVTLKMG